MLKLYQSSRHWVFNILLFYFPILALIFMIGSFISILGSQPENSTLIGVCLSYVAMILILSTMLYSYYNTSYTITQGKIDYEMGLSKGKIIINDIKFIGESSYLSSGSRAALDLDGIKITYGAGYQIFISPKNKFDFINTILEINPKAIRAKGTN